MIIYNNLTNEELLDMIETLQDYDPCYLGEPHNCNDCGACLE